MKGGSLDLGADSLPLLPRDTGDRNRTSPFAFTGNKFEFRAVGSTAAVSWPTTVLNTIITDTLHDLADQLEQGFGKNPTPAKRKQVVRSVLSKAIKAHKRVLFNGDGYDEAWHEEAEKRGLPNLRDSVDALAEINSRESVRLFKSYGVLTKAELDSRATIFFEKYCKQLLIEGETLRSLVRTRVLPASLRHQTELIDALTAAEGVDLEMPELRDQIERLVDLNRACQVRLAALDVALAHEHQNPATHARQIRDKVKPAMEDLREVADELEGLVPADLWSLPTYQEMLIVR